MTSPDICQRHHERHYACLDSLLLLRWMTINFCQVMLVLCIASRNSSSSTMVKASIDDACSLIDHPTSLLCRVTQNTTVDQIHQLLNGVVKHKGVNGVTVKFTPAKSNRTLNYDVITPPSARSDNANDTELRQVALLGCGWYNLPAALFHDVAKTLHSVTINCIRKAANNVSLTVEPGFIAQMANLQMLDLSGNNIEIVKQNFSTLLSLRTLNISGNSLTGPSSLLGFGQSDVIRSFGKKLWANLQILDVSNNGLDYVVAGSFSALHNLTELYLRGNMIRHLEPGSFKNLALLRILDLRKNKLTTFNYGPWEDDLPTLKRLDLGRNQIKQIDSLTFNRLTSLEELDLSSNEIEMVHQLAFSDSTALQILIMDYNKIAHLEPNTFEKLVGLLTLSLKNNDIESINETMLRGLVSLKNLKLDYCEIKFMHEHTFNECCSRLTMLSLHGNQLTYVPDFKNVSGLEYLGLSLNPLSTLTNDSFSCLSNLTELALDKTGMTKIEPGLFDSLVQLKLLSLAENILRRLAKDILTSNIKLHDLDLEECALVSLPNLTSTSLRTLRIRGNRLKYLDTTLLPESLEKLEASYNSISSVHAIGFSKLIHLRQIEMSGNQLISIVGLQFPPSLSEIYVSNNHIKQIDSSDFKNATALNRVEISDNRIMMLEASFFEPLTNIRSSDTSNGTASDIAPPRAIYGIFKFENNPFTCDCYLSWIKEMNIIDFFNVGCCINDLKFPKCPAGHKSNLPKIQNVPIDRFLCPYRRGADFNETACIINSTSESDKTSVCQLLCPEMCQCHYRVKKDGETVVVTVCSRNHLLYVPENISIQSVTLYLDGNNLTALTDKSFGPTQLFPLLENLFLNASAMETLSNSSFTRMPNLQVLHLENNWLWVLPANVFAGLRQLRVLDLHSNRLDALPDGVFRNLTLLTELQLSNNKLTELPSGIVSTVKRLALDGNPWTCSCRNMVGYGEWQRNGLLLAIDEQGVMCRHIQADTKNKITAIKGDNHLLTNTKMADYGLEYCLPESAITITMPTAVATCLLVLATITSILVFVYRYEIQVLIYSHCRFRLTNSLSDDLRDDLFDAFVAYSKEDEWFVVQELMPRLEGALAPAAARPYSLCLHERDFAVGSYISESIDEAVERSKRTLVVMSCNFVASSWCRYEFKTAHYQMMRDKRRRIIVVVLPRGTDGTGTDYEISDKEMDAEMRLYMRTNTYLRWSDRLFWQKLYYAMPDRPPK